VYEGEPYHQFQYHANGDVVRQRPASLHADTPGLTRPSIGSGWSRMRRFCFALRPMHPRAACDRQWKTLARAASSTSFSPSPSLTCPTPCRWPRSVSGPAPPPVCPVRVHAQTRVHARPRVLGAADVHSGAVLWGAVGGAGVRGQRRGACAHDQPYMHGVPCINPAPS
jgi:hypothetical protein